MSFSQEPIKMHSSDFSLQSKLPKAGTTIFTVMSALATKHNAINLSQGFPDFSMPELLTDLVNDFMKKDCNQYVPMPGLPALRKVIREKIKALYNYNYNADTEVTVTAGGTQAIYTAIAAIVHPGDEVIVIEPCYDSYIPSIEMAGGIPVYLQMKSPDFTVPWNDVSSSITSRTRLIIINSPQNPTGKVLSSDDLGQLNEIVKDTNIIVLSDEVYEHIIFDDVKHESVCKYPELAQRSFVIFSFGKTYHCTGWKMGYVLAPEQLMKEFRKVHQFMIFCANAPMQFAFSEFMQQKDHYLSLPEFYQKKRDYFSKILNKTKFDFTPAQGSYFQVASFNKISDMPDTEFCEKLTSDYGVAAIPFSVFYHDKLDEKIIRFCFAKKDETLKAAGDRLLKL